MFAFLRRLLVLGVTVVLSACVQDKEPPAGFSVTAPIPYQLDSGDKLRVIVFGQESLTGSYAVDGAGNVSMPLIGPVRARGTTTNQLRAVLAQRLKAGYLRDPDISIEVEAYRPFFILGEVRNPGQYPYVNGMTVQTAAAIAGGFGPRARTEQVEITRQTATGLVHGSASATALVRPGDTINVAERFF